MKTLALLLVLVAPAVTAGDFAAYTGSYSAGAGRVIDVGPMDEAGGQLVFLEHPSLRIGVLRRVDGERFTAGPSLAAAEPVTVEATFTRDARSGVITGVTWRAGGEAIVAERTSEVVAQDVELQHDGIVLRGTLQRPATKGPHPAIVFAHGSGAATRDVGVWNAWFVRQGFAVLSLDKRAGWERASLDDIAGDWLAGVAYLKTQPDIDAARIGVHGSSQGGWTAPRMAARSKDLAFVIVRAGSALPVLDTMVYEVGHAVRDAGFDAAASARAEAAARAIFELAQRRAAWGDIAAVQAKHAAHAWAASAWPLQMSEDGWSREWLAKNAGFDNAGDLAALRVPVLWFLAEHDHNVDSRRSANALRAAKLHDLTLVEIDDAGHGFTSTRSGNNAEMGAATHMAAGYWDVMATWLRERDFSR